MIDPLKRQELIKALANFCSDDPCEQTREVIMAWNLLFRLHGQHEQWERDNREYGREQKIKDSPS